jgi:hypothetical protein
MNLAPYRKAVAAFIGAAITGGLVRLQTLMTDSGTLTRADWVSVAVAAVVAGLGTAGIVVASPRNVPKAEPPAIPTTPPTPTVPPVTGA